MQKTGTVTIDYDLLVDSVVSQVWISQPFDSTRNQDPDINGYRSYSAVWDTGATISVISKNVVEQCQLTPINYRQVQTVNGAVFLPVFLISILLPNSIGFDQLMAIGSESFGLEDVLIGMDIISEGDFALTNVAKKTVFSFRIPSQKRIDFKTELE